jgi:uncharacterized protein
MRIIIMGGSGHIGTAITRRLTASGHQVSILTRNTGKWKPIQSEQAVLWDGRTTQGWGDLLSVTDAVINLVGENLGAGRWTTNRKHKIISSRVNTGQVIVEAFRQASSPPKVMIQSSAVGYYGDQGQNKITEDYLKGDGFLAETCQKWEASSRGIESLGARRVIIRTGVVLNRDKGILKTLMLPVKLFFGGRLGTGKQGLSWIHIDDVVAAIIFLLEHKQASGPYNLTAPEPVSNDVFGKTLAKLLHRPFWFPVPSAALRLLLGEMSSLVLESQYVYPKRLLELGYSFKFPQAEDALRDLINQDR